MNKNKIVTVGIVLILIVFGTAAFINTRSTQQVLDQCEAIKKDIMLNNLNIEKQEEDSEEYEAIETVIDYGSDLMERNGDYGKPVYLVFKNDGNYYKAADVKFYLDKELKHEVRNPIFISPECRPITRDGITNYWYLSITGEVLFSDGEYTLEKIYDD